MNRSLHQYFYVLGAMCVVFLIPHIISENYWLNLLRGCPACFLILKGVVISSHETNRFS